MTLFVVTYIIKKCYIIDNQEYIFMMILKKVIDNSITLHKTK